MSDHGDTPDTLPETTPPGPGPAGPGADEPAPQPAPGGPSVFPGDVESDASKVRVIPPVNEKGRLLLHGGCLTFTGILLASIVAGTLAGVVGAYVVLRGGFAGTPSEIRVVGQTTAEPVAAAAAAALPSVVNIDISASETAGSGQLPTGHPTVPVTGTGSGVAFKEAPNGGTYLITNEHVIADATKITVTPVGGDPVAGVVVGTDVDTDIAVVRVPVRLPLIRVADSDTLVIGQLVVAIGSPYGLEHSVSSGVVSGTHRSLPESSVNDVTGSYPLVDVIQTDAAINPGNSGGALVDRQGRLVGIDSAIYSESGANAGVGFAIPSNTAVRIADELIATGKAKHPFLGIVGQTVDETLAKEKKLPVTEGAYVVEVTKGTGAAKAGVKAGDVIVSLDGVPIRSMDDLLVEVRGKAVGDKVTLGLYRTGKKIELVMTVGDKPKL